MLSSLIENKRINEMDELLLNKECLEDNKKELVNNNNKLFIFMMIINAIILVILPICGLGLLTATSFALKTVEWITALSTIVLCGFNTFVGFNRIEKNNKRIDTINEQLGYINGVKDKLEHQLSEQKNEENKLKINKKTNWKKGLRLIKTYNKHKKTLKKHYKAGDLEEVLNYSGYDNEETYYLYNRVRNDFENAKVLKKNKSYVDIFDLWGN